MSDLLDGIRVIEFGQLLNPSSVGMYLGDLGADVIKLESPYLGDYMRDIGWMIKPNVALLHVQANKNKRSAAVDLRSDEGRELFWKLHQTADVFVDGTIADAAGRLGIGYDEQRRRKPDIVYCQYSGFGATGAYSSVPTHGMMMGALAGQLPYEMGEDGFMRFSESTSPGTETGGEATAAGAMNSALGIAAALVRRERTGVGAYLDIASSDAVIAQAWFRVVATLNEHRVTKSDLPPFKDKDLTGARYSCYETRDKKVVLFCAIEPKFWRNFCTAVGRTDGAKHTADSLVDYGADDDAMRRELQDLFHTKDQAEWMELAREHDIPLGPAPRDVWEMLEDPHVQDRGMLVAGDHPEAGPFTYVSSAISVAGSPNEIRWPAPALGENTREILESLGIDPAEIDRLAAAKIIGCGRG